MRQLPVDQIVMRVGGAGQGRLNNFNFLRFIFAVLVVFSHAPELRDGTNEYEILTMLFGSISFGEVAVDCFFILSGYLILKSWLASEDLGKFLFARVLRIYPGFIVACLICAIFVGPIFGGEDYFLKFSIPDFFLGLIFLRLSGISDVFHGSSFPILNGSLWSIPYEFKCYLLIAFLGLINFFRHRWALFLICIFLVVVFFAARLLGITFRG